MNTVYKSHTTSQINPHNINGFCDSILDFSMSTNSDNARAVSYSFHTVILV